MESGEGTVMGENEGKILRSKSVSDLLSSISLENLTPVFVLNGYDTTDDIKHMSEDDLDYLGIGDEQAKDIILETIGCLVDNKSEKDLSIEHLTNNMPIIDTNKSPKTDSGFNSSEESPTCEIVFLHHQSFLYQDVTKGGDVRFCVAEI